MIAVGFDDEGEPGTNVVHFYVTKFEAWINLEFLEFFRILRPGTVPIFSPQLTYKIREDGYGIPFVNRFYDVFLKGKEYKDWDDYIHVGTSQFIAR